MGLCVKASTKDGKKIKSWKPANRLEDFEGVFTNETRIGEVEPYDYGQDYQFLVTREMNVGDTILKEIFKEHEEVIMTYDC